MFDNPIASAYESGPRIRQGAGWCGESRVVRVALVEDDRDQAELLRLWLEGAGHDCHHFERGAEFLKRSARDSFDVVMLDWMLPDVGGDEVVARLRERDGYSLPVLFVTSRDREADIVQALEAGADDYMVKPVAKAETLARVAALDRRARRHRVGQPFDLPPFRVDPAAHQVTRDGEALALTEREFALAAFLLRNAGRLLSRRHILESVWETSADLNTRTVDTHVSRIRAKLGLTPESGWRLASVYQHGYRLEQVAARGG